MITMKVKKIMFYVGIGVVSLFSIITIIFSIVNNNKKDFITESMVTAPSLNSSAVTAGNYQNPLNEGKCEFGTFYYSLDGENWSTSLPTHDAPGTYVLKWYVEGDNDHSNYGSKTEPKTFQYTSKGIVTDEMVTAPSINQEALEACSYPGILVAGESTCGTFYYCLDDGSWKTTLPTLNKPGKHTLKWYLKGNECHFDYASKTSPKEIEFTVTATITDSMVTAPAFNEANLSKGPEFPTVTKGKCSYGTIYYSLDKEDWTTTVPQFNKAGTHTLYWYVKGDEDCYYDYGSTEEPKSITFTLEKKRITIDEVDFPYALQLPYTESEQAVFNGGFTYTMGVAFHFSIDKSAWVDSIEYKFTEEGTYKLYWYCTGNDEYYDIGSAQNPIELIGTISAKNITSNEILPPTSGWGLVANGEELKLLEEPIILLAEEDRAKLGTFYYSLDKEKWSEDIPTAIEAGEYFVYWYLSEGEYYNAYGSKNNPFEEYVLINAPEPEEN